MGMPDDRLETIIDRPHATPEVHAKAYQVLANLADRGKLPLVPDGTGNPLQDYVDILGIQR